MICTIMTRKHFLNAQRKQYPNPYAKKNDTSSIMKISIEILYFTSGFFKVF